MKKWFSDNLLALLIIAISSLGAYNLTVNRITVLEMIISKVQVEKYELRKEVKDLQISRNNQLVHATKIHTQLAANDVDQERRSIRLEGVVKNNTVAMNKLIVICERILTNQDNRDGRLNKIEAKLENL